jgi:hypothetical protein
MLPDRRNLHILGCRIEQTLRPNKGYADPVLEDECHQPDVIYNSFFDEAEQK